MRKVSRKYPLRDLRRREPHDEGFTLIELLVVLLIIGILLAIAIPTFLSTTKNASDTAAQANLQSSLTGAKAYYTETNGQQSYSGIDVATGNGQSTISQLAGAPVFVSGGPSTGVNFVSISTQQNGSADALEMTAWSKGTENCWIIVSLSAPQTTAVLGETATGTYYAVDPNVPSASCIAGTGTTFTNWPGSVVAQTGGFPTG